MTSDTSVMGNSMTSDSMTGDSSITEDCSVTGDGSPVKAGDLLYAVGPGHNLPHSATDLRVYSATVENVRQERASATLVIELGNNRPTLGFPQWVYRSYDVGTKIHRSRSDALRAIAEQARLRRDTAERDRARASDEVAWALAATAEGPESAP